MHTKESDGNDVTEVYYVLEGSATYTTGGTMPDPKNRRVEIGIVDVALDIKGEAR